MSKSRWNRGLRATAPLLLLALSMQSRTVEPVRAELPYPDLPFRDVFRAAVRGRIFALTEQGDYYFYCREVDSYLGFTYGFHQKLDGKEYLFKGVTEHPMALASLFDDQGKLYITQCKQRVLSSSGTTSSDISPQNLYAALVRIARRSAEAQIDRAAAVVALSISNQSPACVLSKSGKEQCLGLRDKNRRLPISQIIESGDSLEKAKLLLHATALLSLFSEQDVALTFGSDPLTARIVIFADITSEPLRSIEQADAITRRRQVANKFRFDAEVQRLKDEDAKLKAAAAQKKAIEEAKKPFPCGLPACECDDSCYHGHKD